MREDNRQTGADATELTGQLLVLVQFGLLAAMGWRAITAAPAAGVANALAALAGAGSAALALWALDANRPGNFNIRPTPRHGGVLVTSGPYHWVRHPMYTSVLMAAAACALWSLRAADGVLWIALLMVLWVKASVEERALLQRFPAYQGYHARTKRFLPWLL